MVVVVVVDALSNIPAYNHSDIFFLKKNAVVVVVVVDDDVVCFCLSLPLISVSVLLFFGFIVFLFFCFFCG